MIAEMQLCFLSLLMNSIAKMLKNIYNNVCIYIYINAIFYIVVYVLQPLDLNCPHQAD